MVITREQLHRALDSLPEDALPDVAEYIDCLRQREEPLSPDKLPEVQAADERRIRAPTMPCVRKGLAMVLEVCLITVRRPEPPLPGVGPRAVGAIASPPSYIRRS